MDSGSLEKHLAHFGVRITPVRQLLYSVLCDASTAMSLADLEVALRTVDKSSIFRNLQLFLEVGLIHQIQDGSGVAKYAISDIPKDEHHTNHAHFTCIECAETICLDQLTIEVDDLELPDSYSAKGYTLIIKGICPKCQKRYH